MRKVIQAVDKWGPAAVALLALFIVAGMGWWYSERIAKLEGQVLIMQGLIRSHIDEEKVLRSDLRRIENWTVAVYERGSANNWDLPDIPTRKERKP